MLRTFETSKELYKKFKEICDREGIKIGSKLNEFMENYVKVHGEGNPVYPLDKFLDANFKAVPAFFENIEKKWFPHFQSSNDNELDEIIEQTEKIFHYASAYRNINKIDRANTWFGTQKDAEAGAGF